ncbi:hypothetical protein [Bradyrhizobium sp. I1.7.5]|uniref:hypothetical protein n=1 Tax=Bradyrhizobium sp. I1.7.5 TaxID=3156363 RepID=UPI00339B6537
MNEEEADRYRTEAEECRRLAERAIKQSDKEAWLRLAADWLKLAEGAAPQALGSSGKSKLRITSAKVPTITSATHSAAIP